AALELGVAQRRLQDADVAPAGDLLHDRLHVLTSCSADGSVRQPTSAVPVTARRGRGGSRRGAPGGGGGARGARRRGERSAAPRTEASPLERSRARRRGAPRRPILKRTVRVSMFTARSSPVTGSTIQAVRRRQSSAIPNGALKRSESIATSAGERSHT